MTTAQRPAAYPLPARIFHAAMQRQLSLDAYAATLAVPGDTLRTMLTAQADQLPLEVVTGLAVAHGQQADTRPSQPALLADAEPFSSWLERQMEGVTQASLRTRTQLEPRLLRAFLNGKSLPDADQAERLARALYLDSAEMAGVIVADMLRRTEPSQPAAAQPVEQAPATQGSAPPDAPAKARRRRRPSDAAVAASATALAEESTSAPVPLPPSPSAAGDVEASPSPEDAKPAAPAPERRRRTARPPLAAAAAAAPTPRILAAHEHRSATEEAALPPADTTPSVEVGPPPAAPRRKGRSAHSAELTGAIGQGRVEGEETPAAQPESRAARRTSRARAATPAAPEGASVATGSQAGADEDAGAHPTPPAAPSKEERGGADIAGTGAMAGAQPAAEARKRATERAAVPATSAAITSPETTLELSSDEVRLIRSYRRLHPHGRRATLQYIGSLLIEE